MAIGTADLDAVERELYIDGLSDVIFKNNFFLSQLKVMALGTGGDKIPIRTAPPPGVGASLSTCQTTATARGSKFSAFNVTHKTLHGVARLSGDQVFGTDTEQKAAISLMVSERQGVMSHMAKMLEVLLFRDGWGDIGVVQSFTGATVTLTNAGDANNVEAGMPIVCAAAKATGNIRTASTNRAVILGVNPSEGVLTFTATVTDGTDGISTALANGDTLFISGNRNEASSPAKLVLDGLPSWLPGTNPGDESSAKFFNVDRNGNSRLYGLFLDGSSLSWMELLVTADQLVATNGGTMDLLIVSPRNYKNIQIELQGKIQYTEMAMQTTKSNGKVAQVSFKAIEIVGMNGQIITVAASRGCKDTDAFGLDTSSWSLRCLHPEAVEIFKPDGLTWLRTTGDEVELRCQSRSQLACNAPGYNVRITL